jgi:isopentenyl-diphosphate delta-isomerase
MDTEERKSRHLDICLDDDVASRLDAGWHGVRLRHEALPEIALEDVDTRTTFLGRSLQAPLLISSMTGGTQRAREVNRRLAVAAQRAGFAFGLGSGRAMLEDPTLTPTYAVRDVAPDVFVIANLGAVQLNYGLGVRDAQRLLEATEADALYLHLNPLQEAIQYRGDTNFRGLLPKIAAVCKGLDVPVLVKSVGSGISAATARRLIEAGVAAIDVAGAGGTSWALVEGRRSEDVSRERIAEAFADWGTSTALGVAEIRAALPDIPLIASGGVRTGVDCAKALALGADVCGLALPFLQAATESQEATDALASELVATLRIAMFATGSQTVGALRAARA